jgi:hypothetical protein
MTTRAGLRTSVLQQGIDWLAGDQFDYGEWGKSEVNDPGHAPRTIETSRLKPNVFTSCQAAYALLATHGSHVPEVSRFVDWLVRLRDDSGWWLSAMGSRVPIGANRGWAAVKNIRHTAKGLDVLLLRNDFRADDASVLRALIESQLESGAYAHVEGGDADIWTTAYVMNLILRSRSPGRLRLSTPRGMSDDEWAIELTTRLDRARAWLCGTRTATGRWELPNTDSMWVTQAVIAEIGGDLRLRRPDVCQGLATLLLNTPSATAREPATLWGLLLMWGALRAADQRRVLERVNRFQVDVTDARDTFDVSCRVRVLWHATRPELLDYYVMLSDGHESALARWEPWAESDYDIWCVQKALRRWKSGTLSIQDQPRSRADAWETVGSLLQLFGETVEQRRGWELLWTSASEHRDEKAVQTAFWNTVEPLASSQGVLVTREAETGRGPVDFVFANGTDSRVLIEFKLTESSRLFDGLDSQLVEYMRAARAHAAFFVCVGFQDSSRGRYDTVRKRLLRLLAQRSDLFIETQFVDARRRVGASVERSGR